MGGFASRDSSAAAAMNLRGSTDEEIVHLMLPIYHTKEPLTAAERKAAVDCWTMISYNRCQKFFEMKRQNPAQEWRSAAEWFPIVFYHRLFEVHPSCRASFLRPINKQGGYLVQSVSLFLSMLDAPEKLTSALIHLAQVHNKIGIKAYEYNIVGEVMLWSLNRVLGESVFTHDARVGWVKIYSVMLDIILPVVVRFELQNPGLAVYILERRPKT